MSKMEGFTTVMGGSLAVGIENKQWSISIRRTDDKSGDSFFDFHKKEMKASDIKRFIPNYASLTWKTIDADPFGMEEIAVDGDYKVSLLYSKQNGIKSEDIISEFVNLLA